MNMYETIKQELLSNFDNQDVINEFNEIELENVEGFKPVKTWQEYIKCLLDLNVFYYTTLSEFIQNSEMELSYDLIEYARVLRNELKLFGINTRVYTL